RGAGGRAAQTRPPAGATLLDPHPGEVSERLKERDWKSRGREIPASRVRIPPSPLNRPAPGGWGRGTWYGGAKFRSVLTFGRSATKTRHFSRRCWRAVHGRSS